MPSRVLIVPFVWLVVPLLFAAVVGCGGDSSDSAPDAVIGLSVPSEQESPLDLSDLDQVRERAQDGDPVAQFALGERFARGEGVDQDSARAAEWFRKAAEQGDAGAQLFLGNLYSSGDGVAEDAAEAVRWYMAAAEQGVDGSAAAAQFLLGVAYYNGNGVEKDVEEAYFWLHLADGSETGGSGLKEIAASQFSFERLAAIQQRVEAWRETHAGS